MGTNNFLPFCNTDTGTNLPTQGDYAIDPNRDIGNSPGVASSKLNNKPARQATAITSQVAQYMANKTNINILDDGNMATLLGQMYTTFAPQSSSAIENLTLVATTGSSVLTVAVKTQMGNDPSSTDQVFVSMRNSPLTSGTYNRRTITSALSIGLSNGSTLGQTSGQASRIWVYLIDNAGTLELALSHSYYPENILVTTVAEGGAGAADSATAIYSTTARSNVSIRLIGWLTNSQVTAGNWASNPTQIQLLPENGWIAPTVTTLTSGSGTYNTPAGVKLLKVFCVGGGGGGAGSGTGAGAAGTAGGNTTFGTSLITANGGGVSSWGNSPGAGGAPTINSPAIKTFPTMNGGRGGAGMALASSGAALAGGTGGVSVLGGAGTGTYTGAGSAAIANSGSGGGGSGINGTVNGFSGSGGAAGAAATGLIATPLSSYSYAVGAAGTKEGAGTGAGAAAGGDGGSGVIIIEEYYQ